MGEKIKEAIMQFQTAIDLKEAPMPMNYNINIEDAKVLLNYIELLQQENAKLKETLENNSKINVSDHKYASDMEDKLLELRDENTRLKEAVNNTYESSQDMMHEMQQEIENYKKILNEFEKWLDEKNTINLNENFTVIRLADIKDKLQELKEGKNEKSND